MDLGRAFLIIFAGWGVSECLMALFRRGRDSPGARRDRGSMLLLFGAIFLAVPLAVTAARRSWLPIPLAGSPRLLLAICTMIAGLLLRWISILLLGSMFTMSVTVQREHRLIERGPYRWLRHPSYTGLLLTLLGVGTGLGDLLALALLLVLPAAALYYRIRVEEAALISAFGESYREYRSRTWALFPGL